MEDDSPAGDAEVVEEPVHGAVDDGSLFGVSVVREPVGGDGGGSGGAQVAHDGGRFEECKVVCIQDGGDFSKGVDFEVFG